MSSEDFIRTFFGRHFEQFEVAGERIIQDINRAFNLTKEEPSMSAVKLIAYTQPVESQMTMSELIAYCARVSNPANQHNYATMPKLMSHLLRERHWSPFEMVNLVIGVETTRDIARQVLRHRSFCFQEFSQRYAEVVAPPRFREARLQDKKNRQSSIETDDASLQAWWRDTQSDSYIRAHVQYKQALDKGIAKEVARALLPEGLTMSSMYMNGNIKSWYHYCQVRRDKSTQKEHREIAEQCWAIVVDAVPALGEVEI